MMSQQLFTDHDLTALKLANQLDMHPNRLSQLIRSHFGQGIPDFINSFRISRARRLLSDPAWHHLTIEAIGEEAGFRSRSAFYQAFKTKTGLTPAAFKKMSGFSKSEQTGPAIA